MSMMKLINPTQQTAERGKQTTLTPQTVKLVFFFVLFYLSASSSPMMLRLTATRYRSDELDLKPGK